jgi:phytoene dehydrogenase-like protein
VSGLTIANGGVRGVELADGQRLPTRTVLADVGAPYLYHQLIGDEHLSPRLIEDLRRFEWDSPTMKVNWALSAPIPWTATEARRAGTVHLGVDLDGLTMYAASLAAQRMPRDPFVLLGQMTTTDASRSPAGTESVWAYTHVPHGTSGARAYAAHARRMEAVIEARAPGFKDTVIARQVQAPDDLESANPNLVGGAVGGGTASIHQQLVFRPIPGLGGADTPIDGVYLAGASAHPGGGVHGGPGANAAAAAIRRARVTGAARRRMLDLAFARIYR